MADEPWWKSAFGADYLEVYAHRDDGQAEREIAQVATRLQGIGGPILDAGCGNGRHLAALRKRGLVAFGCDFSFALLRAAGERMACRGALVRADLRLPPFGSGWGAILLLFTAFGYFDDAGNAEYLRGLAELLRPGGLLVLDLPERDHLKQSLIPASSRRTPRGVLVEERRSMNGDRVEKVITVREDGRLAKTFRESVRLYGRDELTALARAHGLVVREFWPGLLGPEQDQRRLVAWLERPA